MNFWGALQVLVRQVDVANRLVADLLEAAARPLRAHDNGNRLAQRSVGEATHAGGMARLRHAEQPPAEQASAKAGAGACGLHQFGVAKVSWW